MSLEWKYVVSIFFPNLGDPPIQIIYANGSLQKSAYSGIHNSTMHLVNECFTIKLKMTEEPNHI